MKSLLRNIHTTTPPSPGDYSSLVATLEQAAAQGIIIRDLALNGADLRHANLDGATFINVSFQDCDLTGANMSECKFADCNFTLTRLHDTCFCYSDFQSCRFDSAFYSSTDISEACFSHCIFRGHGIHNLNLAQAYLIESCAFPCSSVTKLCGSNALTHHENPSQPHTKDIEQPQNTTTFD